MSYCRFSSDDFRSDVYVYCGIGGWMTHVASRRTVYDEPLPPEIDSLFLDEDGVKAWIDRFKRVQQLKQHMIELDHPLAGETFIDDSPGECADRLVGLRDEGFIVPQDAIDRLREEQEAMNRGDCDDIEV